MKSNTFHVKLLWLLFGQLLERFWLVFNLSSGHSEHEPQVGSTWSHSSTPSPRSSRRSAPSCAQGFEIWCEDGGDRVPGSRPGTRDSRKSIDAASNPGDGLDGLLKKFAV